MAVRLTFVPAVIVFWLVPVRSMSATLSLAVTEPLVAVSEMPLPTFTSPFTLEIVRSDAASTSSESVMMSAAFSVIEVLEEVTDSLKVNVSSAPVPSTVI